MDIDWQTLFVPSRPILEMVIRGSVIYLVLFVVMRFLPRRTIGSMSASDILIIVIIADAVQGGLAGDSNSITEALVVAATVFGWASLIDWLDYRLPHLHIAAAREKPVIDDGRILRENLDRARITEEELLSQLRLHGQESPATVRKAYLEGDGRISVILRHQERVEPVSKRPGL